MNLSPDHGDVERAIAELEKALPITALRSIIANREAGHRARAELRRRLKMLLAEQILRELKPVDLPFLPPPEAA
jgi:hypothetical protein